MEVCVYSCGGSQAVAAAVCEGGFGELHHSGPALPDDLGGAAQQLLSLGERLGQLLLPLHELRVALHGRQTCWCLDQSMMGEPGGRGLPHTAAQTASPL